MSKQRCIEFTTKGDACRSYAKPGTDKCHYHSMTVAQRTEWHRRGKHARVHATRTRADASESISGITPGTTLQQILDVCTQALNAKLITGEVDWGARLSACAVLLNCFPRSLRREPEQATEILRSVLAGTKHEALADKDPREPFRKLRQEWYETRRRVDSLNLIYVIPVPEWAIGPGETRSEIMQTEAPTFDGWSVRRLKDAQGRELREHVMLIKPDGSEVLAPRDDLPLEVLEAQGVHNEPLDVVRA
jgi:hypothetical protein